VNPPCRVFLKKFLDPFADEKRARKSTKIGNPFKGLCAFFLDGARAHCPLLAFHSKLWEKRVLYFAGKIRPRKKFMPPDEFFFRIRFFFFRSGSFCPPPQNPLRAVSLRPPSLLKISLSFMRGLPPPRIFVPPPCVFIKAAETFFLGRNPFAPEPLSGWRSVFDRVREMAVYFFFPSFRFILGCNGQLWSVPSHTILKTYIPEGFADFRGFGNFFGPPLFF